MLLQADIARQDAATSSKTFFEGIGDSLGVLDRVFSGVGDIGVASTLRRDLRAKGIAMAVTLAGVAVLCLAK